MRGSTRRQPLQQHPPARLPTLTGPVTQPTRGLLGFIPERSSPLSDAALGKAHGPSDASAAVPKVPYAPAAPEIAAARGATAPAASGDTEVPLPPSRIPAAFHVRDAAGRLLFPSERPEGDIDVGVLAETLGGMLEEWRERLEENKPSFPLGGARWGVLQMCIYDMCARLRRPPAPPAFRAAHRAARTHANRRARARRPGGARSRRRASGILA